MAAYLGQLFGAMPGWLAVVTMVVVAVSTVIVAGLWIDACWGTGEAMKWIRRRTYDKK